jgi:hypothetical protein
LPIISFVIVAKTFPKMTWRGEVPIITARPPREATPRILQRRAMETMICPGALQI